MEFIRLIKALTRYNIPVKDNSMLKRIKALIQSRSESEDIIDYREWLMKWLS
jgi:hypothetical protein